MKHKPRSKIWVAVDTEDGEIICLGKALTKKQAEDRANDENKNMLFHFVIVQYALVTKGSK